jgi:hypothetical protein
MVESRCARIIFRSGIQGLFSLQGLSYWRRLSHICVHQTEPLSSTPPPERLAEYTRAKSVAISLDSVVFDDGTMAGPDAQNNFVSYSATLAADRDFAAAVLAVQSGPAAALQGCLDSFASRQRGGPPLYDSQYNHRQASDARRLRMVLANRGAVEVFDAARSMAQDAAAFTLHR